MEIITFYLRDIEIEQSTVSKKKKPTPNKKPWLVEGFLFPNLSWVSLHRVSCCSVFWEGLLNQHSAAGGLADRSDLPGPVNSGQKS